jgi:hypothetical protein
LLPRPALALEAVEPHLDGGVIEVDLHGAPVGLLDGDLVAAAGESVVMR